MLEMPHMLNLADFGMRAWVKHVMEAEKQIIMKAVLAIQDEYLNIDDAFEEEMAKYRTSIARRCEICGWLKT